MRLVPFITGAMALQLGALGAIGCKSTDDTATPPYAPVAPRDHMDAGLRPVRPPRPTTTDEDAGAGPALADEDGGVLFEECRNVDAVPFIAEDTAGGEFVNAIAAPSDFSATRVVATWGTGCDPATIIIKLSNGRCPDGNGHELTFTLDASAIESGELVTGIHTIDPDAGEGPIRVRYVRPERSDPVGEWGSCAGASGTFSVRGNLTTEARTSMQALFELELSPCDGSMLPNQTVRGTFNVSLYRARTEVCP